MRKLFAYFLLYFFTINCLFVSCSNEVEKTPDILDIPHVHTYNKFYSYDEEFHWYEPTCEHKNEITKAKHIWDEGLVSEETTTEKEGVRTFTCEVCGARKNETIEKLERTFTKKIIIIIGGTLDSMHEDLAFSIFGGIKKDDVIRVIAYCYSGERLVQKKVFEITDLKYMETLSDYNYYGIGPTGFCNFCSNVYSKNFQKCVTVGGYTYDFFIETRMFAENKYTTKYEIYVNDKKI